MLGLDRRETIAVGESQDFETFYRSLPLDRSLHSQFETVAALAILHDPEDQVYLSKLSYSLFELSQIVSEARREGSDEAALNLFLSVALSAIVPNPQTISHVRALSDNLLESQRRTKEKVAQADEAIKSRDTLLTIFRGLLHDLRNPLASIKTSTYLLRKYLEMRQKAAREAQAVNVGTQLVEGEPLTVTLSAPSDVQLFDRSDMIELQTDFMSDLLDNASMLFNMREKKVEQKSENVGVLVTESARQLRDEADTKGLVLEVVALDKVVVMGDAIQLKRMLINLIGNAIKYTDQGKVAIKMVIENGRVSISIQDTGPGMSAGDQAHLFEPFFRSDNTAKKPGTGLGLVVVKEIVEQHGGNIAVQSQLTQGTTFTVTLPVFTAAA